VANETSHFKATADEHQKRDLEAEGKWVCTCEACRAVRALPGVEKMLAVRPVLRELLATADKLEQVPEGEEKQGLVELYHNLHDKLADKLAR
jgi:hypothetical protein